MYNEQQKTEAGKIVWELINCGIARNAYSSVEIAALQQANHVINSPTIDPEEVPVVTSPEEAIAVETEK